MQSFYYRSSNGMRITVSPRYTPEHSDAREPRYLFVYHIRIENVGERTAQLLWRHWYIHDDVGGDTEVQGEGVVGEQPILAPGDVHEYESFCILQGQTGHMVGSYFFKCPDGTEFEAEIPKFELSAS